MNVNVSAKATDFTVTPLTGAIGASVRGIDLANLDDTTFARIKAAFLQHCMLVFPQQFLEERAHLAFAARWGEISITPMLTKRSRVVLAVLICSWPAVGFAPTTGAGVGSGPPYDLAEIRDPKTLRIEVVRDWRLVPGDPPTRQKSMIVTACTWWPGREIRLPVALVAPAEGGPFPFVISSIGLKPQQAVKPDSLAQALLPRGVAFVHVGIGSIDHSPWAMCVPAAQSISKIRPTAAQAAVREINNPNAPSSSSEPIRR